MRVPRDVLDRHQFEDEDEAARHLQGDRRRGQARALLAGLRRRRDERGAGVERDEVVGLLRRRVEDGDELVVALVVVVDEVGGRPLDDGRRVLRQPHLNHRRLLRVDGDAGLAGEVVQIRPVDHRDRRCPDGLLTRLGGGSRRRFRRGPFRRAAPLLASRRTARRRFLRVRLARRLLAGVS